MTWEIVVGMGALFTMGIAFMKPVISLTKAMTTLNVTVKDLKDSMSDIVVKNQESHKRIWDHSNGQDIKIEDHESRIIKIETKMEFQEKK